MSTKKEPSTKKIANYKIDVISFFISLLSVLISVVLIYYQVTQDRLPTVVCLNCDIEIEVFKNNDENDILTYYDQIVSIPIYNIGVGTAQNCELTWDLESVNNAYFLLLDVLDPYISFNKFESKDLLNARPYLYDYSLQYKNQKLESIWVLNTYPEKSQSYSVDLESMYYPYLLSVNETDTNDYFCVPKPIVPLLVDLAKYEINEPVSLDLKISFQDIAGKAYTEKYRLTFTFDEFIEDIDNNKDYCTYKIVSQKL